MVQTFEGFRRNADDCEIRATEVDVSPDNGNISSELMRPQIVGKHDHRVPGWNLILLRIEAAAKLRRNAKHVKEIAADQESHLHLRLGLRVPGEAERRQLIG